MFSRFFYPTSGTDYSVPFPYQSNLEILVYLNGAIQSLNTHYTFPNPGTIRFTTTPSGVVGIFRSTQKTTNKIVFVDTAVDLANDRNLEDTQLLYSVQEACDLGAQSLGTSLLDGTNFDAGNKRILNLSDPVNDTDVANKQYLDRRIAALLPAGGTMIGPLSSTVGHVPVFNNTTGTLLSDPTGSTATLLTNRSANYSTSMNYGGTSAASGIIEVLGSAGTPNSTQDAVAIFQKWSNSTTNYNLGINPTVYVSNILKSGAATARGTALYAEAQLDVNAVTSANFCEGIRGHGSINAGIAGGEATGVVAFAGEAAGATHAYMFGIEAEVAVNSVNASYSYGGGTSNSGHFEACFLATARSAKQPLAAYMINPFTAAVSAPRIGFFVPPASPNVAGTPVVDAAFRSDAPCVWGMDLTGHGAGATFGSIALPNAIPIRAITADALNFANVFNFDASNHLLVGADPTYVAQLLLGVVTKPVIMVGDLTLNVSGPTIRAGTGVPSYTAPAGSLFLRTDGAAGSHVYCSSGGGVWIAAGTI